MDFPCCFAVLDRERLVFSGREAMRLYSAMAAALLITCAAPPASRADGLPAAAAPAAETPAPGCRCPGYLRHARRAYRHVWVRHWRHRRHFAVAFVPPPLIVPYDPPIPAPWDSAYDRGMTLHFRSPVVSGSYIGEPWWPHTPPIRPFTAYRLASGGGVLQYDGLTGVYIPLAQVDARRFLPPPAAEPVPLVR
jgi:hypothetical protein